jgi:nucleoside-diphosphate-sugar epimerase
VKIAVTGATGFVGSHLVDRALAAGHQILALTRRPQPERQGVEWIPGDLADRAAHKRLVEGADAVIHIAGVLNVPTELEFAAGNVEGTLAMLAAVTAAGVRRFVFVSSLAAREPHLSMYGASKAKAEGFVESSGLDWVIVRPPAVYGPGDRETLELFKMARRGVMLMPPSGRFSLIHAADLADLLLAFASPEAPAKLIVEPDDGRAEGWSHKEFGAALGGALGRRPVIFSAPPFLLNLAARGDMLLRRGKAKLTRDRAAYFAHPNWVADRAKQVPRELWQPRVETRRGLYETAAWYRTAGWMRG